MPKSSIAKHTPKSFSSSSSPKANSAASITARSVISTCKAPGCSPVSLRTFGIKVGLLDKLVRREVHAQQGHSVRVPFAPLLGLPAGLFDDQFSYAANKASLLRDL